MSSTPSSSDHRGQLDQRPIAGIKAVGFDLDNTLYVQTPEVHASIQNHIARRAAELLGRDYDAVKREFDAHYAELHSAGQSLREMGIANCGVDPRDIVQEALEQADVASVLSRDDRLVAMFDRLDQVLPLFLITTSGRVIAHRKLYAIGIEPIRFRVALYAEEANRGLERRDGTAFCHVAQELGVRLDEMLFVGDREKTDITPAAELGMKTAIVNARSEHATIELASIYDLECLLLGR